jgi:hypothetical protein
MARQKHDLTHVVGIVGQLPIDRFHHSVRFTTDGDRLLEILPADGRDRPDRQLPTRFPARQETLPGVRFFALELPVALAVGLLAIACQKIGPARPHVAGQVLHDQSDAVRLGVKGLK